MQQFIQEKILPKVMKFVNSTPVVAIKEGFISTMALTIIGSIFLLLAHFPYEPIREFFVNVNLTPVFLQAFNATFNILAAVAVFSIAYFYVKHRGYTAIGAGLLALVSYILLIDFSKKGEDGEIIEGVISLEYLGSKGMIASIIIGLFVGAIYCWFFKKKITIKMPEGVPEGVSNSFASIIPGACIITITMIVFAIFRSFNTTFIDFIYTFLQIPLQGMTSTLYGAILMVLAMNILWWFGIHGSSIVAGIMSGILTANMNFNQDLLDKGIPLTVENGAHIVTFNFRALLLIMTGSGITIGIVIYFLFFAKSEQFKSLGKLSIGPAIFNINEPVLFGTPVILNPLLLIPFIFVPVVVTIVSYLAMKIGLVPIMGAINPPWTTPPLISGFLVGGIRLLLLQLVIILISFIGYFPFIRKQDQINLKIEQSQKGVK